MEPTTGSRNGLKAMGLVSDPPPPRGTSDPLNRFRDEFSDVPGFLMPESEVVWDYLLSAQNQMGVIGDPLEIDVFEGRSEYLASLYMKRGETIVLVDISDPAGVAHRTAQWGAPALYMWPVIRH